MSFAYFDHNAGTGLAEGVLERMLPYLKQQEGNPSSSHRFGRFAHAALDKARQQVADLVNAHPSQVIFTSGGTEANNLAIAGLAEQYDIGKLVMSPTEHPSMLEPAKRMHRHGFELDLLAVDENGLIQAEQLMSQLDEQTRLLSVMWANNETGVIQDIPALAAIAAEKQIPIVTDAVQAAGKILVDFKAAGVQMMSLSAHKFGGPKGIGALIVAPHFDWPAFVLGGGQENGWRSGTENVAAIVGFGAAAEQAQQHLSSYQLHCQQLTQLLEQKLKAIAGITIFAEKAERLPNTVFFSLQGFDSDTLLMTLDRHGFAVSSGSACGTGQQTPSHVLTAMGIEDEKALGAVRVSVGPNNSVQQIEQLADVLTIEANRFSHLMNR